jgi:hypothetical protein
MTILRPQSWGDWLNIVLRTSGSTNYAMVRGNFAEKTEREPMFLRD